MKFILKIIIGLHVLKLLPVQKNFECLYIYIYIHCILGTKVDSDSWISDLVKNPDI